MRALKGLALLAAFDSDDVDDVVLGRVVIHYDHLAFRFGDINLSRIATWARDMPTNRMFY